jgi:AraC family transcriptional activator of pobA
MKPSHEGFFVCYDFLTFAMIMNHIPVHKLKSRAEIGLEINHTSDSKIKKHSGIIGAHRDDHYIFFVLEEGEVSLMVDFTEVTIAARSLFFVLPGQVHYGTGSEGTIGWFIAVDTTLIPKDLRSVFENSFLLQQPYDLNDAQYQKLQNILHLMHDHYLSDTDSTFYVNILQSLLNSFLGMAACGYCNQTSAIQK